MVAVGTVENQKVIYKADDIPISLRHLAVRRIMPSLKEINEMKDFWTPEYRRNRPKAHVAGGSHNDQSNYCYAA